MPGANSGGIGSTRRALYRLPDLLAAAQDGYTIYLVEGEKCADAVNACAEVDHVFATTNPGGAKSWRDEYADHLAGAARVVVWRDRDPDGENWSHAVTTSLCKREIPHAIVESPHEHDVADHLAAGHGLDDVDAVDIVGDGPGETGVGDSGPSTEPADAPPATEAASDAEEVPELPEQCWRTGFQEFREAVSHTTEASDAYLFAAYAVAASVGLDHLHVFMGQTVRPNLYACCVGRTGIARKTTGHRWVDELLHADQGRVSRAAGSAEGLLKALQSDPRRVLSIGEMATLLTKGAQDGSAGLLPMLTNLYDCPASVENLTVKSPTRVESPYVCIITSTTRAWLHDTMTATSIRAGFAGRFCYLTGRQKAPKPWTDPPDWNTLANAVHILRPGEPRTDTRIDMPLEARELWDPWYIAERERTEDNPILDALRQRLHTNAIKLALIYAGLEGTDQITPGQVAAALAFAEYQRQAVAYVYKGFRDRAARIDWGEAEESLIRWMKARHTGGQKFRRRDAQRAWVNNTRESRRTYVFVRLWDSLEKVDALEIVDGLVVRVHR